MHALSKVGTGSVYDDSQLKDALASLYRASSGEGGCDHIFGWNEWSQHELSMLQKITATVYLDYEAVVAPSIRELEESANEFIQRHGSILNLHTVISSTTPRMALAAEYKRASPSKGRIASDEHGNAGEQAVKYTRGGADIISCLTEPRWFQGTLADLTEIRLQTQQLSSLRRPAVLRKDFVISEYMIAEAAAAGADTVLLIVAILPVPLLRELMAYCRTRHMVPLVEVNTDAEFDIALSVGATVIGINNRNLHTFQLDLSTSERIAQRLSAFRPENESNGEDKILLCALSGMSTCHDVQRYRTAGISMCLIGESLMRSSDPAGAIASLCLDPVDFEKLNSTTETNHSVSTTAMMTAAYTAGTQWIKVCGITSEEDALVACQAGANLIGIIFVPKSKRCVSSPEVAKRIVATVRLFGERSEVMEYSGLPTESTLPPKHHIVKSTSALVQTAKHRPMVVGVFQNQEMDFIRNMVDICGFDMVQLHGNEGMAAANRSNFGGIPVIRVVDVATDPVTGHAADNAAEVILQSLTNDPSIILLDTSIKNAANGGGTGIAFDWTIAGRIQDAGVPVMVAGGLTPENVADCIAQIRPFGVDVSSGVEMEPGRKDHAKIRAFVQSARAASVEASKGF